MILPDVNVLVYAFRREADRHERYAGWLAQLVAGADELALVDPVLTGFVRIVTHPRIFAEPAPTTAALAFVRILRGAPRSRELVAGDATWDRLGRWAGDDVALRGNLVPDGWIAAVASSHGCRVATADRGFARFPGVTSFDPAS